ncbi:hypothetical protein, partial [Streptococcus pneumoniae]|uniref:hypothetical protein n=1 Tax=Streptococcus pneumoniae TaxID=1313 RepID=UPI0013D952DB
MAAGLGGLVGTALAFPAQAQQALVLDEITVTATRAARPIEQVPTTVQVIERAEIEQQLQFSNNPAVALSKLIPG